MIKFKFISNTCKKILKFNFSILAIVIFLLIFSINFYLVFTPINNKILVKAEGQYTPSPPIGNTTGNINVEYEYLFYTSDIGSSWKFDWGDGNYSDWIIVENNYSYISQINSWNSYGNYEVRIKYKSIFGTESSWSQPLIVKISPPLDLDDDGWDNDIEVSYNKDPKNPDEFPLDTDSDGTPDEDSYDGKYNGDSDDDNDGLSDIIEVELKLNPKKINNVIISVIKGINYYLIDKNGDGNYNILYDPITNIQTNTEIQNGIIFLDIDNDGSWDFTYINGTMKNYEGEFPWLFMLVIIILIPIIIIISLFKMGILFLYQEEYIEEE